MATMGREGFEYEDVEPEAAFEAADDEAYEAADEPEAEGDYETDDEASDEPGEAMYEAADLSGDEGVEAYAEDDGEIMEEPPDEAVVAATASSRRWVGKVQADQRKEAARAVATQQTIAKQLRAIPAVPQPRAQALGRLQGSHVFTARLENGRTARMILAPTPAPISEVNRLRATINTNDRRQSAAISANARALKALAATQADAVKKLTSEQVKSDRALSQRMTEGLTRLDKRITSELSTRGGSLAKHRKGMSAMLRRHRRRSLARTLTLTTALPTFAAFGDRTSPLSATNLKLTGVLAASLVAPEVIDLLGGGGKGGATFRRLGDFAAYAGAIVNPGVSFLLFRNAQNQRFATAVEGSFTANQTRDAAFTIAKDSAGAFEKAAAANKIPVVITKLAGPGNVTAAFANGKLQLSADAAVDGTTRVAWMMDTQPST
ncbi:MAG TPA: hypothetical protein VEB43_05005 [Anaeromyxobacter sp.]|nr:hypothetical protein [Anaeromyxobacter sp.]